MKTSKRILAAIMVVLMLVTSAPLDGFTEIKLPKIAMPDLSGLFTTASAASEIDGLAYKEENGSITITGYSGIAASVVIPSVIEGKNVTKIGNSAFNNCKTLVSISIPDSVTEIGDDAFKQSGLTFLVLPKSITSLGHYFLCETAITEITIPKTLAKCDAWGGGGPFAGSSIKTVKIEEGIPAIPHSIFSNCSTLETVNIPNSVTKIDNNAFYGCKNLKEISIPDSVTEIGDDAFKQSGLTSLVLPKSITSLGHYFLCETAITEITIPKTLAKCDSWGGGGPFAGSSIKTAKIEEGIPAIPAEMFSGCSTLESITIPESVTSIGNSAFYGCKSLQNVYINNDVKTLGRTVFTECPYVVLYCNYYSNATIYAIDNNISFQTTGNYPPEGESAFDRSKTRYIAAVDAVSTNGYINMTVDYKITNSKITDKKLEITLPVGVELIEESLKLNNVLCTDYTLKDERFLTVPLKDNEGTLKCSIKTKGDNDILSYAALSYKKDHVYNKEIIGIINENIDLIAMDLPDCVSENKVDVVGVAPASAEVEIYLGEELVTKIKASKAGCWNTTIELTNPDNLKTYTVTAKCKDANGAVMEAKGEVTYRVGEPSITGFTMGYNEHNVDKEVNLLSDSSTTPVIYFLPGKEFKFELEFENPEAIKDLYVTSTRNNITKYLKAEYDEKTGTFKTNGFFDEDNHNYVPGTISYEYNRVTPEIKVTENVDWSAYAATVHGGAGKSITFNENTDADCETTIDLGSFIEDMVGVGVDVGFSIYDEATDGNLADWMGIIGDSTNILEYITVSEDGKDLKIKIDTSDPYKWITIVEDVSGDKFIKYTIDAAADKAAGMNAYKLDMLSNNLSTLNSVASFAYKYYSIEKDMDELREEVYRGSYATDAERQQALDRVDALEMDQKWFELAMWAIPLVVTAGAVMPAAGIVFTAILGCYAALGSVAFEMRKGQIKGGKFKIKMVIDPSGYVYDIDTNARLEGVTATAYCVEYDESEGFWDKKPADTEYGKVWNASEYNQQNPLLTNFEGKYAWDVPEGWWRVKYEKDGYETTWSEWMTVPPVQTEVNIGMKNIAPQVHTHTEATIPATPATYTADGLTEGKKCTSCGEILVAQKTVARKKLTKVSGVKTKSVKLVSGTKSTLTLSWSKVTGAEKYVVEQYINKKWKTVATTKKTSYTVKKLKANKSYKFRVKAQAGKYYGSYSKTYTAKTVPLTPTLTVKAGKKQLTASWKTVANITGYEVQYSTSKKFTKKTTKSVTIKKAKTKKTTVKSLKKGKKYYVKVRAFKTVGKKKIYGSWSTVKTVKVK